MKKYYYIGVIQNNSENDTLSYVYKIEDGECAYWKPYSELHKEGLKPKTFTKTAAENIVHGLVCNYTIAFVITSYIEFI